jgi:predicted transcriptional regulator
MITQRKKNWLPNSHKDKIYNAILQHSAGLTVREIINITKIEQPIVSARLQELIFDNWCSSHRLNSRLRIIKVIPDKYADLRTVPLEQN